MDSNCPLSINKLYYEYSISIVKKLKKILSINSPIYFKKWIFEYWDRYTFNHRFFRSFFSRSFQEGRRRIYRFESLCEISFKTLGNTESSKDWFHLFRRDIFIHRNGSKLSSLIEFLCNKSFQILSRAVVNEKRDSSQMEISTEPKNIYKISRRIRYDNRQESTTNLSSISLPVKYRRESPPPCNSFIAARTLFIRRMW